MPSKLRLCVIVLYLHLSSCESANILYVTPFPAKSHDIMLKPIGLELARRGHNVTVITANREKIHPSNYRQVMVDNKDFWELIAKKETGVKRANVFEMVKLTSEDFYNIILWGGARACTEVALNSSEVQKFLHEDNNFDLVINEQFFGEAFNILAHKYNAPLVLVTTAGHCMRHNVVFRNPLQLATTISEHLYVDDPNSFKSRLRNFYFTVYEYFWWNYWYLGKQDEMVKKYVPNLAEPVPNLFYMQRNAALILVNGHFSFDNPMAYLPNIVEIGGAHLSKSNTSLPDDLQTIMNNAVYGVVYVNFGSNVKSSELPDDKRDAFLNVFRRLKETVIWKWEEDNLPNKPDNLVTRKWLPQKDILAHPNVKVFIAHGGLIGTQEAIYHGVPIIGIPIYGDQYNNLMQVKHHGFGNILLYDDINEKTLEKNLREVLTNESYRSKAKAVSRRFKDRPMTPLDTAILWIEYVIRHKGAPFMKNPALELSWIEYNMFDVYAFVLAVMVFSLYFSFKGILCIKSVLQVNENRISKNLKIKPH